MLCRLSVLMLLAASALAHLDLSLLDSQWNEWKLTHRREYGSQVSTRAEKVEEDSVSSFGSGGFPDEEAGF